MSLIGKLCCVVCIVFLIPQFLECGTINDLCGFQRCESGRTFCHDNRCRQCSDLDGTRYECQNDSTWRMCFLHCKDKLTQEHEIDKQKYNQTLNKRLVECQQHSQISNITRSYENAPKEINFYILIASIAVVGLCIALVIVLFLGRKVWRTSLAQRKGNRHGDPESPHLLMFDKHEEEDKFTTMTSSVLSDDTYIKTVSRSETSTERENGEDSNIPEETISCFTDHRRDLLRGVPPVQELSEIRDNPRQHLSKVVVSNSQFDDS